MSAIRRYKISSNEVAGAYQCTRQNACLLLRKYGEEAVENPDQLFRLMLEERGSNVRSRLCDPDFRKRAAASLSGAAFRYGLNQALKKTIREDP